MAVKIRLKRIGAKKNPFYRIVVADARYPRDGRFIEQIGTYDPMTDPAKVVIDGLRALKWMENGAQPTDTVRSLLKKTGALEAAKIELSAEKAKSSAQEAPAAGYREYEPKIPSDAADVPDVHDVPEEAAVASETADSDDAMPDGAKFADADSIADADAEREGGPTTAEGADTQGGGE